MLQKNGVKSLQVDMKNVFLHGEDYQTQRDTED